MITLQAINQRPISTTRAVSNTPKQTLYFGADTAQKAPDPINAMTTGDIIGRYVAVAWSEPTGVEKELKALSNTIDEKQHITFPYVMLALAPFVVASFLLMPWLGLLGLPLSIYALVKLRNEHRRLGKAMRDQYRSLTDKLNIQPDFPLPYKGGPLPTKPPVTA